jgi:hypothetical protein
MNLDLRDKREIKADEEKTRGRLERHLANHRQIAIVATEGKAHFHRAPTDSLLFFPYYVHLISPLTLFYCFFWLTQKTHLLSPN